MSRRYGSIQAAKAAGDCEICLDAPAVIGTVCRPCFKKAVRGLARFTLKQEKKKKNHMLFDEVLQRMRLKTLTDRSEAQLERRFRSRARMWT